MFVSVTQFEGTWVNGELKGKGTYYYGDHRCVLFVVLYLEGLRTNAIQRLQG